MNYCRRYPLLLVVLLLAGCGEGGSSTTVPRPESLTRDAVGHYCQMLVADHEGPKAQLFLDDRAEPYWFSSVRDAVAFTLLPEEPKNIAAIYVNDMTGANWTRPGNGNWIDAHDAWYVLDSVRVGGMGAPEAVPFATGEAARAFSHAHGGRVVRFDTINADYVLGEVATPAMTAPHAMQGHSLAPVAGSNPATGSADGGHVPGHGTH